MSTLLSTIIKNTRFSNITNTPTTLVGYGITDSTGATGAGGDQVFVENSAIITTSYTLSAGKNAMSVGPITINSGAVVTVPTGQVWSVL